jgi:hypothetical protein
MGMNTETPLKGGLLLPPDASPAAEAAATPGVPPLSEHSDYQKIVQ